VRSGILLVDKAAGMTSFDVVGLVRRRLGARRVGHAGTLDPDASGVLPTLVGEATKLMAYLSDQDKEYLATIRLGVVTDTQDLGGRVLRTAPVPTLEGEALARAARAFVGRIPQVPPMFSAVHHEGRRLYELARQGREVPRPARQVVVHAITVEAVALPSVRLRIVCGKGTYVRALAADLGQALGCGAALEQLVRSRVGPFTLAEAMSSEQVAAASAEVLWSRLRPPQTALVDWPVARLDARAVAAFVHGQAVELRPPLSAATGRFVAVFEGDTEFVGVGERSGEGDWLKPVRILHADRPGPRVLPA
jgi:tRNA pseudouridine55 synthase